jgi:hypothetical protein
MKAVTNLLGLAAILALSSTALADDKTVKSSPADTFDTLPKSKLEIPRTATLPKSIAATEKVDGYYVEIPTHYGGRGQGPTYATVSASKAEADARNAGQPIEGAPSCFMTAYPNYGSDINWSASFGTSTSVQNYSQASYPGAPQYGSVQLVRSDHIVKEEKDKLTYEVKIAYVDAATTGVRLHSKQTLEFSLVQEMPGKVKVWGAKSDDQVLFLVRREKHAKERFFFGPLMVTVNGQHVISAQEACPVVFSLKAGKGVATSAVVQVEALLEIEEVKDEDAEEPGFISSIPARHPSMGGFNQLEAKIRPMRIGVSSTWMSQDTKPVVSVSHGWSGRERTQAI